MEYFQKFNKATNGSPLTKAISQKLINFLKTCLLLQDGTLVH